MIILLKIHQIHHTKIILMKSLLITQPVYIHISLKGPYFNHFIIFHGYYYYPKQLEAFYLCLYST